MHSDKLLTEKVPDIPSPTAKKCEIQINGFYRMIEIRGEIFNEKFSLKEDETQ